MICICSQVLDINDNSPCTKLHASLLVQVAKKGGTARTRSSLYRGLQRLMAQSLYNWRVLLAVFEMNAVKTLQILARLALTLSK